MGWDDGAESTRKRDGAKETRPGSRAEGAGNRDGPLQRQARVSGGGEGGEGSDGEGG